MLQVKLNSGFQPGLILNSLIENQGWDIFIWIPFWPVTYTLGQLYTVL